jgi:hypothetical protein
MLVVAVALTAVVTLPSLAFAQRAVARPGGPAGGGGGRAGGGPVVGQAVPRPPGSVPGHPVVGYPGYGYPYYGYPYHASFGFSFGFGVGFGYPGFAFGFGFGYPFYPYYGYPYYGYPYYGYPYYPAPYAPGPATSALHLQVTPRQAEVYLDGSKAGIVDNFDGTFQRLYIPPGQHQLTIYMAGYHSIDEQVYVGPGSTQTIKAALQPLAAGEPQDPRPVPVEPPAQTEPQGQPGGHNMRVGPPMQLPGGVHPPSGAPPYESQPSQNMERPTSPPPPPQRADPASYGTLTVRLQPGGGTGTSLTIDGYAWPAPGNGDQLVVRLPEGKHHVQVQRPGYTTFSSDVDVTRGDATPLNVSLQRRANQ